MGTWSIPQTKEKAAELESLMAQEIPARDASQKLSRLLGDDSLFDAIDKYEPHEDIRHQVVLTLENFLGQPAECFTKPWEPEAREICKKIIDHFLNEIENSELYKLDEKTGFENYHTFISELQKLSRKYGVIIQSTGGVRLCHPRYPYLKRLYYNADLSSGDLYSTGLPEHI
jgi:hypothetical protein